MSIPQPAYQSRLRVYTSLSAAVKFTPPISWIKVVDAGDLVVKDERGDAATFAGVLAGEVITGPFTELTSTTSTKLWLGDGPPPPPSPASSAFSQLYTDATSSQGLIELRPAAFYLATGAPLAIFADGASAVPGSAFVDSKAFGFRWNNNATFNNVTASFLVPPDLDITANAVLHIRASKTGATVGDAVTFDVGAFNQVDGALHDADTDFGGVSSAMTGNATAKTIQNLTRTLALADLAAHPASITLTLKPTNGTLGTDDVVFHGAYLLYRKKLLTS